MAARGCDNKMRDGGGASLHSIVMTSGPVSHSRCGYQRGRTEKEKEGEKGRSDITCIVLASFLFLMAIGFL